MKSYAVGSRIYRTLQADLINNLYTEMKREAIAVVREGTDAADLIESRQVYMRYVGQGHEIAVNLPVDDYDDRHGDIFRTEFERAYTKLYGQTIAGIDIEALSWTLTIAAPTPDIADAPVCPEPSILPEPIASQSLFDPDVTERVRAPVYLRSDLSPGMKIEGPALITEDQTTTVVTAGYHAKINGHGYIVMTLQGIDGNE